MRSDRIRRPRNRYSGPKSADGTLVPLSIVSQKGAPRDGSHPLLLDGYGSYGVSINPYFDPRLKAWIEQGGVFATAHVRGGGEYGEDWHLGGKEATKQHTIDDFLACAQYLIDQKYTSPRLLAGEGTSAGGILIGGAITQRPDLFRAALVRVGVVNALRFELTAGGPANIAEFGTNKTESGFNALLKMDAYAHVRDGVAYPGVMFTTGVNDPRVAPWMPGKMAASRLADLWPRVLLSAWSARKSRRIVIGTRLAPMSGMPRCSRLASLFLVLSLTACLRHPSDSEPLACAAIDAFEPNDSQSSAADLGELHDDPDSSRSITGSLSSLRDVDFYAVHIKDTGFGGDPNITVSVPEGFSVTTTFVCDSGSVYEMKCLQGEPDQDACRGTDSTTDEDGNVTYTTDVIAASTTDCAGTSDDDGVLYIRVEASNPSTCSYSLTIDVE